MRLQDWSLQHCHDDGKVRLRGFTENHPVYHGPQTICTSPVKAIAFLEVPDEPSTLFGWTPRRLAAVTENNLYDLGQFRDGYEFVSVLADQGINLPLYFLKEAN